MGLAPTNYTDHNDSAAVHLLVVLHACQSTTVNIHWHRYVGPKELLVSGHLV